MGDYSANVSKILKTHVISRNGGLFTNEFFDNSGEYASLDNVEVHNVKNTVIAPTRTGYTFGGWKDNTETTLVRFYRTNGLNPHIGISGVSKDYEYLGYIVNGRTYTPIWYDLEVPKINSISSTVNFSTSQTATINASDNGSGIAGYYIGKTEPTEANYKASKISFESNTNNSYSKVIDSAGTWYFAVIDKEGNWTYQSREYYSVSLDFSQSEVDRNNLSCKITSLLAEKNTSITLPTVTTTGYTATTWKKNGSGAITSLSVTSSGITLATNWGANTYTLTYNANGGTCSTANKSIKYKEAYGTLPTPSRTGYTFTGWFTAASGGTKVETTTTMSAGNTTIYAHWNINNYTLTYNANGGTCSTANKSVTYNTAYGTLPTPSRSGYEFTGWYTAASGGSQVSANTLMGASNTTIYAHWIGVFSVSVTNGSDTYSGSATTGNASISVSQNVSYTISYGLTSGSYTTTSMPTFTNAGTYKVYYKITANGYRDYTGSYTVTINKLTTTLTLSATSGSMKYPTTQTSFTVSSNVGADKVSVSTSNSGVATASRSNGTVTVTWVSAGTATITCSVAGTSNYTAASKTYTVTTNLGTIDYTATSYGGQYDGSSHSATLTVNTSGCTVKYGTTAGTYNLTSMPSYSAAGSYQVYFQITKANYETVTGSVSVVLRKSSAMSIYEGTNPDVRTSATQTTFNNRGYLTKAYWSDASYSSSANSVQLKESNTATTLTTGLTCTRKVYANEAGQVVFEWYFQNNSGSDKYVGASIDTDLYIGGSDSVPCTSTSTGFYMSAGGYTFDFFCKDYNGITHNATGIWVGAYGDRTRYYYYTGNTSSCSGIDSGMCVNWQNIRIPNGGSDSIKCIFDMR